MTTRLPGLRLCFLGPQAARLPERRMLPDSFRLLIIIGSLIFFLLVLSQLLWSDIQHKLEPGLGTPMAEQA